MFPRVARWGHAGKMVEILRFPHVFMTASPRFTLSHIHPRFPSSQSSKSLRFWACWSTWVKRPEKPYLMGKLLKFKPRRWEIDLGWTWEINSPDMFGARFSGDQLSWICCQRGPSCWIVAQLLDFQEFLGLSAAKTKEIKAAGLESWRVAGRNPSKSRNPWGPYSNCRRKDGTARGVESGSALRGPFRDFGFAWHGFLDLLLLAL